MGNQGIKRQARQTSPPCFSYAGLGAPGAVTCLLLKQLDTERPQELHVPMG